MTVMHSPFWLDASTFEYQSYAFRRTEGSKDGITKMFYDRKTPSRTDNEYNKVKNENDNQLKEWNAN